jgi:hypothetical protein
MAAGVEARPPGVRIRVDLLSATASPEQPGARGPFPDHRPPAPPTAPILEDVSRRRPPNSARRRPGRAFVAIASSVTHHDEIRDLADAIIEAQEREIGILKRHASGEHHG